MIAEGSEQVVMADPSLVIAYPPIQRIIKQEIPSANSVEEENLQSTLQLPKDSVVMTDPPLKAYPPIKRGTVKLEIPDDDQEVSNLVEENLILEPPKDSVVMANQPIIAYPPIQRTVKPEILDEHHEVSNYGEEKQKLQLHNKSITTTGNITSASGLSITNASLRSEDHSGENIKGRLRAASNPPRRERETHLNASEEGETQQDTNMMDTEEEGSEYDKGSQKSEHSSLEDVDESDNSFAVDSTDDEDLVLRPKAGPSKKPRRQAQKEDGSNQTALKKGPFECSKCARSYQHKASLSVHLKYDCGDEAQFPCTMCERRFKSKHVLRRHLINIHKVDRNQLDKHGAGLKKCQVLPFKCSKCNSSFKHQRSLVQHTKSECGASFDCSVCKQKYSTKTALRNHLLAAHSISRSELDKFGAGLKVRPVNPHKCDQCERTYTLKKNLARHLSESNCCGSVDRRKFKCNLCGRSFKQKQHLKQHLVGTCGK